VGAAHKKSNDEVFQGYYSLTVNKITANCYWGNSFSNANATVSVIGQDGEQNVSTSSVTTSNGWVNFVASGFTFSAPTIKVRYMAPKPTPTPAATESPTPTAAALKKTTITCIKGKVVKKVTGVKPVCPKGYKKK
jgi:hypothetical protein